MELFGQPNVRKDGSEGKIMVFPNLEEMHTSPDFVRQWVEYTVYDTEITYLLRETLAG